MFYLMERGPKFDVSFKCISYMLGEEWVTLVG